MVLGERWRLPWDFVLAQRLDLAGAFFLSSHGHTRPEAVGPPLVLVVVEFGALFPVVFVHVVKLAWLAGAQYFPVHGGARTRPVARRGRKGSIVTLPFGVGRLRFGFGCPGFLILRFISWLISRLIVYSTPYQIRTLRHKTAQVSVQVHIYIHI